jgi:hypothetical protein
MRRIRSVRVLHARRSTDKPQGIIGKKPADAIDVPAGEVGPSWGKFRSRFGRGQGVRDFGLHWRERLRVAPVIELTQTQDSELTRLARPGRAIDAAPGARRQGLARSAVRREASSQAPASATSTAFSR